MQNLKMSPSESWDESALGRTAFRVLVVIAQGATIFITWPLWQARHTPPMLPALPFPEISTGPLLIFSLICVLVKPRIGVYLHWATLLIAMVMDQTRIQPEFICLAVLMYGTLDSIEAQLVARTYLIAMWFFAGFHKLVNPDYYMDSVPRLLVPLLGTERPWPLVCDVLRGGLAFGEMSLAFLAVIPRTRKLCAILAAVLHLSIFFYLSLRMRHNLAVWPWNLTLAIAGFALIWPWKSTFRADWRVSSWAVRLATIFLLVSPFGYYFGAVDAYFSHCLYTNNTIQAQIVHADGTQTALDWTVFNTPFPPAHRLFDDYFAKVAAPGDVLHVTDPRWWARIRGYSHRTVEKDKLP